MWLGRKLRRCPANWKGSVEEESATMAFTNSSGVGALVCRAFLGASFACSTLLFFGDGVGELMRMLGGTNGFLHEL